MPNTRPRVVFNADGVCNACTYSELKKTFNWPERKEEFLKLLEQHRGKQKWDCIVPWSGGKDSSSIAYKLKFEYDMNPLLVTFSPMIPNDLATHNREAMIQAGFDHIFFRPNQKVLRNLGRRFFIERGHPKVAWDAGINSVPVQAAVNYNIPLLFYAEHGESEYGGHILNSDSSKFRDFTEVIENQVGDDPRNWLSEDVREADLAPYVYPDLSQVQKVGIKAVYFAYFFKWSMLENYEYLKTKIDFAVHPKMRTPGTFTEFDSIDDKMDNLYYYMQYIKFGFGRALRDACRMIQNNQMTREQGLELTQLYDGEFPEEHLPEVLDYLKMDYKELHKIIDLHRNQEIWKKENGKWVLRYPPQ